MSETPRYYALAYVADYQTDICGVFSTLEAAESARDRMIVLGRQRALLEIMAVKRDALQPWAEEQIPQARS